MTQTRQNLALVEELVRRVPEFPAEQKGWYADLPYEAFGTFALFLCCNIRSGATNEFLERAFSLLNEMALSSDAEVLDLLVTGTLEVIADDPHCSVVAEQQLNELGGHLLRRVRDGWNSSLS